jgi:hypothetical protein
MLCVLTEGVFEIHGEKNAGRRDAGRARCNAESQGARALRQQATRAATSNRFAATIQPLNARTSQVVSS